MSEKYVTITESAGEVTITVQEQPTEVEITISNVGALASLNNGLPSGGTTGQVPVKASNNDFDVIWSDLHSFTTLFENQLV